MNNLMGSGLDSPMRSGLNSLMGLGLNNLMRSGLISLMGRIKMSIYKEIRCVPNKREPSMRKLQLNDSKPILHMLESIRVCIRRDGMKKHSGDLCPKIQKYLEQMKKKSMEFIAHGNGKNQFEIETSYGPSLTIEKKDKDEAVKAKVTKNVSKQKLSNVGVIMHYCICGKSNHNNKGCPTIKPSVEEGLDIPTPIGRGMISSGKKKKPSNITDGESSGTAATNEMGRNNGDSRGVVHVPLEIGKGIKKQKQYSAIPCKGNQKQSSALTSKSTIHLKKSSKPTKCVFKKSCKPTKCLEQIQDSRGVNLNVHKESSNTEVSSNPEIRAKDKALNTQKALTKLTWVPPLKSILDGVRFSNTKRGQLSVKNMGTSAPQEEP
ncbi:hypothetical protein BUALT_Bualt03G0179000 [Buddleja alternifolia]|uniref:Uncharacterized protein n=1 Tax=Buddleja alternifolia TaxID=168488 RepID=A0AAV6Y5L6_9LAMI|nr:hypothetical protein BUALT_Bualt03G0179000 [Buddleja alternifolia]